MATYRVIRASEDYEIIVVVSPEDADPEDECTFYARRKQGDERKVTEVTKKAAMQYFSGIADGMGWGKLPDKVFSSLEEVEVWRAQAAEEFYESFKAKFNKRMEERGKDFRLE